MKLLTEPILKPGLESQEAEIVFMLRLQIAILKKLQKLAVEDYHINTKLQETFINLKRTSYPKSDADREDNRSREMVPVRERVSKGDSDARFYKKKNGEKSKLGYRNAFATDIKAGELISLAQDKGVILNVPMRMHAERDVYPKAMFDYDNDLNVYICPEGNQLKQCSQNDEFTTYRGNAKTCKNVQ